jgi:hypothetical protein
VEAVAVGTLLGLAAGLTPGRRLAPIAAATLGRGFAAGAAMAVRPLLLAVPAVVLCVIAAPGAVPFGVAFGFGFAVGGAALAGVVEAGRRRGTSRLLPRGVTARVGTPGVVERLRGARLLSAGLVLVAVAVLAADRL